MHPKMESVVDLLRITASAVRKRMHPAGAPPKGQRAADKQASNHFKREIVKAQRPIIL
jgi:hypothetical protein